jgi:hypothetical protein
VPLDSTSKVLRRIQFRKIACPSAIQCGSLKQLIQHSLALLEEYHDDVRLGFHLLFFCEAECMVFQILALLQRKDDSGIRSQASKSSQSREVHLLPIPSDQGCSQHFGSVSSTFHHRVSSDFKNLVVGLNCRNLVIQASEFSAPGAADSANRQQPGRQPADQAALSWQMLRVNFLPLAQGYDFRTDVKGQGIRFNPAIPCSEFDSFQSVSAAGGGGVSYSTKMSKGQKKKARQKRIAKAADPNPSAESSQFLSPCLIPRARLFLCYRADVGEDGNVPPKHLEIDPSRPLNESVSEFEEKFSGQE